MKSDSRFLLVTMCSYIPTFVDVQGFIVNDKFMVKEVAVLRHGWTITHHVFTAPMAWNLLTRAEKSKICWLIGNHHGLAWKDGDVEYNRAKEIIRRAVCDGASEDNASERRIYVKGIEKKHWLEKIIGDAVRDIDASIENIDVDYEDIGRLETLAAIRSFRCMRHSRHCAMENVCKLRDWWMERNKCIKDIISNESRL